MKHPRQPLNGHQNSTLNTEIKKMILETAKDFDIKVKSDPTCIQLFHAGKVLVMHYKQRKPNTQGMYSINGSSKDDYFNARACIIKQLGININHAG